LDIGYHGGFAHKRDSLNDIAENKMQEYLEEYEHRKRERTYFKRMKAGGVPASSIHQDSIHGNSYHGRKIIAIESLDVNGSQSGQTSRRQSAEAIAGNAPAESAQAPESSA